MDSIFNFNRPYVRNSGRTSTPVYLPGENYSLYINPADGPISEVCNYNLYIVNPHTLEPVYEVGTLDILFVAGSVGYHIYIQNFVFPPIDDGQYFFRLRKIPESGVSLDGPLSDIFIVSRNCLDTTSYVSYRHNDALYNIRYDLLPQFRSNFRLPINLIDAPDISSKRDEYRQSSGQRELRLSKSFRDIKQKFEMYWASLETFEALSAMLEHSDVMINGLGLILIDQVKVESVSPFSTLLKGTFNAIVKEDAEVFYAADYLAFGGTSGYICYTSFLIGGEI